MSRYLFFFIILISAFGSDKDVTPKVFRGSTEHPFDLYKYADESTSKIFEEVFKPMVVDNYWDQMDSTNKKVFAEKWPGLNDYFFEVWSYCLTDGLTFDHDHYLEKLQKEHDKVPALLATKIKDILKNSAQEINPIKKQIIAFTYQTIAKYKAEKAKPIKPSTNARGAAKNDNDNFM